MISSYFFLLRPCVGRLAGRPKIMKYMSDNLQNFIAYEDVEKWFSIDHDVLPTLTDFDAILDFKTNQEIKTIAIYVSPYKRLFYYFLSSLRIKEPKDFLIHKDQVTPENFSAFCEVAISKFPGYAINLTDAYQPSDTLSIHYSLEYDNLVNDMQKIPNLEKTPVDLISANQEVMDQYRMCYTDHTRGIVEQVFAKDIELRGYTF